MELTRLSHNRNKKLFLFSCCMPVKGSARGAIYDLQRDDIELVPNSLIDFISYINKKPVQSILDEWGDNEIAWEYLELLIEKEFVFFSSEDHFPKLSNKCFNDDTSKIEYMTLVVSDFVVNNFKMILERIEYLGVKRLHLHWPLETDKEKILELIHVLKHSSVVNLSISLPYQKDFNPNSIKEQRLTNLYFYNSPYSESIEIYKVNLYFLKHSEQDFLLPKAGINTISINHRAFLTGRNANLGLYKTVFVNANGMLQLNSIDLKEYGNILDSEIENNLFLLSEVWNLKRDKIMPCRKCELKYACTANFIPEYDHEKKTYFVNCNYNPYTNEWSN
ncbi:hypothetical protein [Chryseobacterium jejuense]|uniref:hypothetical protein n=1 Tax=Chryseobacterium jejuense TaxID=445960 RepID=UPI001AE91F3D|nr:hypothetical protein [Chryseobacterium jejuense]MBP2618272.1 SPASM domain peptide maturase of grasp-with-spasm system [Chryseobacterium jejuense]